MPPPTFHGTSQLIPKPDERIFKIGQGWSTVKRWEGTKEAALAAGKEIADTNLADVRVSSDGASHVLAATYPDAQDTDTDADQGTLNVTWEQFGDPCEKELTTHPDLMPAEGSGGDQDRADIALVDYLVAHAGQDPDGVEIIPSVLSTKVQNYRTLLLKGTKAYQLGAYRIRKTIRVASGAEVVASKTNINQVEAPVGAPAEFFSFPTSAGKGSATMEWLKQVPDVVYLGRGRFSIVQEWIGANKWSALLYGGTAQP